MLRNGGVLNPDSEQVAKDYDTQYRRSLSIPDAELVMTLDKLLLNYGVIDPARDQDSERLCIALRLLDTNSLAGKTILDYGCGTAKASVVFVQAGAEVFGFDSSSTSILLGKRRARVNGVEERVHLSVASGDKLPYKSASFDYVFGYEVLYYLNGKLNYSDEILRVLKPNGTAVFCESLAGNPLLNTSRAILRNLTRSIRRTGGAALTLDQIRVAFGPPAHLEVFPVNLLAMAKRVVGRPGVGSRRTLALLKKVDRYLLDRNPWLRRWCGEVVLKVTK